MMNKFQRKDLHHFIQQIMLLYDTPEEREEALQSWYKRAKEEATYEVSEVSQFIRNTLREEKDKALNRSIYMLNSLFSWPIEEEKVNMTIGRALEEIDRFDREIGHIEKAVSDDRPLFESCFHYELRRQLTSPFVSGTESHETLVEKIIEDIGFFERHPVEVSFWAQHFLAVERYHREEAIEQDKRIDELAAVMHRLDTGGKIDSVREFLLYLEHRIINDGDKDLKGLSREVAAELSGHLNPELFPLIKLELATYFTMVAHAFCLAENISEEDQNRVQQLYMTREMVTLRDLMLLLYDQIMIERRMPSASVLLDRLQDLGFAVEHKDFRDTYKIKLIPAEDTIRYEKKKLALFLDLADLQGDMSKELEGQKFRLEEIFSDQVRQVNEMLSSIIEARKQPLPKAELIKKATLFAINWKLASHENEKNRLPADVLIKETNEFLSGPLLKLVRPRKGYEFKNKDSFHGFLKKEADVYLETIGRVCRKKKVESLFDFKYFCRWLIFGELYRQMSDNEGNIRLEKVKEICDFLSKLDMDFVYSRANKEKFNLEETYPCSPVSFYKFLLRYLDIDEITSRVNNCSGSEEQILRDEIRKEIDKILPEWGATIFRLLVAYERKKNGLSRLSGNPEEIPQLIKILAPAFCHLEELAIERGREFLRRKGDSLFLKQIRPCIETEEEFRAFVRYQIKKYMYGQDVEIFSISHDLQALEGFIDERLSEVDIIPDMSFPDTVYSIILEELKPAAEKETGVLSEEATQILRLLPKSNCGSCGETSCLAFAYGLLRRRRKPDECQQMSPGEVSSVKDLLDQILVLIQPELSKEESGEWKEHLRVFNDASFALSRQIFWERLGEIFQEKQKRLQIFKKPSSNDLYRLFTKYLGFEATERIRVDEKQYLVSHGETWINAGWQEFFDTYDWFHRVQVTRKSMPFIEDHDALHQSAKYYRDKLFLYQLSDLDRALVLDYRMYKFMDGFSQWWNEDLLQLSAPGYQIQDWEDFSKIIKNAYWHQESSPASEEIFRSIQEEMEGDNELFDASIEMLREFILGIISERAQKYTEEKNLLEKFTSVESVEDTNQLARILSFIVNDIALKEKTLPELSLGRRTSAVFSAFDALGINISPNLMWRWEKLPVEVQNYLLESRVVDTDELNHFQRSKEGIIWREMITLREELLKGFIVKDLQALEMEEIELQYFESQIRDVLSQQGGFRLVPGSLSLYIDRLCRVEHGKEEIYENIKKLLRDHPDWEEQLLEEALCRLIRERQLIVTLGESRVSEAPQALVKCIDEHIRSRHVMDKERLLHYLFILAKMEGNLDALTALLREIRETSDIIEAAWLNFTTERAGESPKVIKDRVKTTGIPLEAINIRDKEKLNRYLKEGLPRGEKPLMNRAVWEIINVIRFYILQYAEGEVSASKILQSIKAEGYDLSAFSEDALVKAIETQISQRSNYADQKIWIFTSVIARKVASQSPELLEVEKLFFKQKGKLIKAKEGEALLPHAELASKRGVELAKVKEKVYYELSDLLEDERIKSFQMRIKQIVNQLDEKRADIYKGWDSGEINRRTVFYVLRQFQKEKQEPDWDDFRRFIRDQRTIRIQKLEESSAPDAEEIRNILEDSFEALLGINLRSLEEESLQAAKEKLGKLQKDQAEEILDTFGREPFIEAPSTHHDLMGQSTPAVSKTSSFISVKVDTNKAPELLLEVSLDASLSATINGLDDETAEKIKPAEKNLRQQFEILRENAALTGIKRLLVWDNYVHAAHLDPSDTVNFSVHALRYVDDGTLFLTDHLEAHALLSEPQDSRIPPHLSVLVEEICALRHSLEEIRKTHRVLSTVEEELIVPFEMSDGMLDPEGKARILIRDFMSRQDWREQDIFEMILEFIGEMPQIYGGLSLEMDFLNDIRAKDHLEYEKLITGMISEARANLEGVAAARRYLQQKTSKTNKISPEGFKGIIDAMGLALGIPADARNRLGSEIGEKAPSETWEMLYRKAQEFTEKSGKHIEIKNFERASLFLLPELKRKDLGHARFCRSLIENTSSYNKILAGIYASEDVQINLLKQQIEKFNRLPENSEVPVDYTPEEMKWWVKIFFLRPDVVSAIVNREKRKDIYQVISGLGPRAYLPRVLHEVQNAFGYITPEAFANIVGMLKLDPTDVIKVIASFKEFSADPSGDIIIYICKGTACFLRGQPHISRSLSAVIGADKGKVADCGIQYIEMDCFGVCHMAPVMKAGDTFIPTVDPERIPGLVEQLLAGVSYENRVSFLNRVRRILARGRHRVFKRKLRIAGAACLGDENELIGHGVAINAEGVLKLVNGNEDRILGSLVPRSFSFKYATGIGENAIGSLILDETNQVTHIVNYYDSSLEEALQHTMKPLAMVRNGKVEIRFERRVIALGDLNSNTVVVRTADKHYASITFDGPNAMAQLEEERGIPTRRQEPEDPKFIQRQDRVLLGFAAGVDPDSIDSYFEKGGYEALRKVLGLESGQRWNPEDIIKQVKESHLRGRGGAGFPTGRKWEGLYRAKPTIEEKDENQDPIKLIVANGDEGDPGAFMDRTLIQERPHLLIEGMVIAALAIGARYGIIYVRKEYEDAVRRVENALFQARRRKILGKDICGIKGLNFDIEIRLGAGAFVAGEKRAIMRAIEGKPAEPTLKAVSNSRRGLWGKPTLLNNVETFANVPLIIIKGGGWFKRQGYKNSGGTKIFSVAGIVKQTGLVEVYFGRTLKDIINICGGIKEGKKLAGVQIGGPSGAILSLTGIREYLLHTPLDFDVFQQVGAMLGSGGLVFIGEDDDVVRLARHFTDWLEDESCGQCPACIGGTVSLGRTLDTILNGEGLSHHIHALWAKGDAVKSGSQCGLGRTAANPVTSALRFFPQFFLHYLLQNPKLDRLELFRCLEALRLLTRENVEIISKRQRVVVGYIFTMRKGMVATFYHLLKTIDLYRSPQKQQAWRFLQLLGIEEHEVGKWDITGNYNLERIAKHEESMKDTGYDVLRPAV